jgi:aerobic carbon-monoxide dehydrogenase large subunit
MIGQSVRRREDGRFLTGGGCYTADLRLRDALHMVVVRSPHAHARILQIDAETARQAPGVLGVFTIDDLSELRDALPPPVVPAAPVKPYRQSALADGLVRYVGEAVAVVVAVDAYRAADAAEVVGVEYEPLAATVDPTRAVDPAAPLVHDHWQTNVATTVDLQTGDLEKALREAALVVTQHFRCGRLTALPLEPRAAVGRWDPTTGELHLWSSTQMPYGVRQRLAEALKLDLQAVRVTAPDVGGGFGTKGPVYPEELIVGALARRLGRPVRWCETREGSFVSTTHAGDQLHDATLALDVKGRILALADDFLIDAGAYLPRGAVVAGVTAAHLLGLYRIPAFRCRGRVVVTHKVPSAPYRGAGRPQATFVAERLMDIAARRLGLDPVELRRRNLIDAAELPYDRQLPYRDGMPMIHDSGDYPTLLETALERVGYSTFRARQRAARREGRLLGAGVAAYNEATAIGPHEGALVRVETDGRVCVTVGTPCQGQGHETTLAQICADRLDVPLSSVSLVGGDTARFPVSAGTYASRVAVIVGTAVVMAAEAVRDKIRRVAALAFECDSEDVLVANAGAHVRGAPSRALSLADLATVAARPDIVRALGEPFLIATRYYSPERVTWASGVHAALVEVDRLTGAVSVLAYHAVHDSGHEINPRIVEGQTQGGVVQGIGAALGEEIIYDERGQPLTRTLMDYALPRADGVPWIDVARCDTPSPLNPLGFKGTGEGSAVPGPAVIANAVADALAMEGVEIVEVPIGPELLQRALDARVYSRGTGGKNG